MPAPLIGSDLIERIAKGQVVAVVGAGVSMAATGGAKPPAGAGFCSLVSITCMAVANTRLVRWLADRQNEALNGDLNDCQCWSKGVLGSFLVPMPLG